MLTETINVARLAHYAPDLLAGCERVQLWLETRGYANTNATREIERLIQHLKECGVTTVTSTNEPIPNDYDLATTDIDD